MHNRSFSEKKVKFHKKAKMGEKKFSYKSFTTSLIGVQKPSFPLSANVEKLRFLFILLVAYYTGTC